MVKVVKVSQNNEDYERMRLVRKVFGYNLLQMDYLDMGCFFEWCIDNEGSLLRGWLDNDGFLCGGKFGIESS